MRFIHTADWQIGKPFKRFGDRECVLRQARLTAIEKIGHLAERENAAHVLVAGDIYDTEAPTPRTLLEPLERMRRFANVAWHIIPGNHDPHRPKGVWDRVREGGEITHVINTGGRFATACVTGGPDRRSLFLITAHATPELFAKRATTARIEMADLEIPAAGNP